jgi:hypothetical protein
MKAIKTLFFLIILISFSSCYQDKGDFLRIYGIELSVDLSEVSLDKTVNFTVKTDYGLDVTNEAKIFIQDIASSNLPIESGTSLTSTTNKIFKVYAEYPNPNDKAKFLRSNEITVKFDEYAQSFVKRVLIEDYTGAWCVSCPRVSYSIELLKQDNVRVVPVAIHLGNSQGSFDPFNFDGAAPLLALVNFNGEYPAGKINRMTPWPYAQNTPNNQTYVKNFTLGDPVRLGLAMTSTLSGNTVNLDVNVKFFENYNNLKLVVYVLENNLIYPQKNSTPFYGGLSLIPEFEHNHVVRTTFTDILGDVIPSSETSYGKTYTRNFSVAVPSNITNTANMEFVAFVVGQDNKAINVRKAAIGENQPFEENN